jgi:hypothetical protein
MLRGPWPPALAGRARLLAGKSPEPGGGRLPGWPAGLPAKIARQGADEDKHGRILTALLRKRGLEPVAVPPDADCTMRLEAAGIGLAQTRLRREEELTAAGAVTYLAHSRVTGQRASEQMRALRRHAGDRPGIARATLRAAALAEIAIYRDVSLAVMAHLGRILGWRRPKSAVLAAGIRAVYACERLSGWRRMVALHRPARRNALGGPVPAQPSHA